MLTYSTAIACFEHSILLTVNDAGPMPGDLTPDMFTTKMDTDEKYTPREGRTAFRVQKFNYELFNCNNFSIRYWSWNYRGCWHQTCPPIDPR